MAGNDRPLFVDDFVNAQVGMEVGLYVLENGDRAVGASTAMYQSMSEIVLTR